MNALRLNQGAPTKYFSERTGLSLGELEPQWQTLTEKGLVEIEQGNLRTTDLGRRFLNTVLETYIDVE